LNCTSAIFPKTLLLAGFQADLHSGPGVNNKPIKPNMRAGKTLEKFSRHASACRGKPPAWIVPKSGRRRVAPNYLITTVQPLIGHNVFLIFFDCPARNWPLINAWISGRRRLVDFLNWRKDVLKHCEVNNYLNKIGC